MSDLLLYNARLFDPVVSSCQQDNNIVIIKDGKISELLNKDIISAQEFENLKANSKKILDLNNQWLTPGLIDCHTHLIFAGSRASEFAERLNGVSYQEITKAGGGINKTVTATREASFDHLLDVSIQRINHVIKHGVTTIEIKSGYGLDFATEEKILKVADYIEKNYPISVQKTFLGAHVVPKEYNGKPECYIDTLITEVLPRLHAQGLVDAVDGFCEGIAFSAEQLEPLYQKAHDLNLKIKGHTEQLSNIGGAKLICKYNGISCDHLEYADESVVKLLKQSGTSAVLLPGAFYYLNETRKPPIELLRKYNINIAIATDFNPGTSPIISLPAIMNMACVLYKLTPIEVWQGVTINAAKALGMDKTIGSIEVGKDADLVIWEFTEPNDLCYYMDHRCDRKIIKHGNLIKI